ncbi:MAG TPA: single-stranded DNA-binding protein [Anaerolineales bacterium]|nr:single-stranded DNA-binding protein [Anaerolineales bacterium]
MAGLNRIQLIGNLGKDPETRFTPKGSKVCTFSVAVNRRWKSGDGAPKEATDWFNIEAWGRLGEICQQYLHKGSRIYLEGRLETTKYEQDGETRYFTKVVANQMIMLERRAGEEAFAELEYEEEGEDTEE